MNGCLGHAVTRCWSSVRKPGAGKLARRASGKGGCRKASLLFDTATTHLTKKEGVEPHQSMQWPPGVVPREHKARQTQSGHAKYTTTPMSAM